MKRNCSLFPSPLPDYPLGVELRYAKIVLGGIPELIQTLLCTSLHYEGVTCAFERTLKVILFGDKGGLTEDEATYRSLKSTQPHLK